MKSSEIAYRIRRLVTENASLAEMPEKFGFTAEELDKFLAMRSWTKLSEKKPPVKGDYLCKWIGGHDVFQYDGKHFYVKHCNGEMDPLISKWMVIPPDEE